MTIPKQLDYFDTVYLRAAFYPLSAYKRIPQTEAGIHAFVKALYQDKTFTTAIYLASPELYQEWKRSYTGPTTPEKSDRLNRSVIKYYIRATSNSIPFGMFASYSVIDMKQPVVPDERKDYTVYASIDTHYIYLVIAELQANPVVKSRLRYVVNNTLYRLGDYFRYVAADVSGKTESRNYILTSIERDEVLQLVLDTCKQAGKTRTELTDLLLEQVADITREEAAGYIEDLIASYVLNSPLEICLNDQSPVKQLYKFLYEEFGMETGNEQLDEIIQGIDRVIRGFDNLTLNKMDIPFCTEIADTIKKITRTGGIKSIVHADLKNNAPVYENTFEADKAGVLKAISLLSMFSTRTPHRHLVPSKNLYDFKKAFIARYGDNRDVPFLEALDNECGIGYKQDQGSAVAFSALIDDLPLSNKGSGGMRVYADKQIDEFWLSVFLKAIKDNQTTIDLQKEDLSAFEGRTPQVTGTSTILYRKYGDRLHVISAGGASATHYLGRFTANDEHLALFAEEIAAMESNSFPGKISAEVLHMATNKAGNVSHRHIKRKFELPILTKTTGRANVINPEDLLICVTDDRIVLKSKEHNKEIVPFLSCAQNYHWDTLPYYHLLCDLQSQYRPNLLSLDFSTMIHEHFPFIPRVMYGDKMVLSAATWKIKKSDLKNLQAKEPALLLEEFRLFRNKWHIPRYVNLNEKGHELLLDLENEYLQAILFETLSKKGVAVINECLYDMDSPGNNYANEFNLSIYKRPVQEAGKELMTGQAQKTVQERFIPGNEWIYYKLYTGTHTADKLLTNPVKTIAAQLLAKKLIDKWFFVRYGDPDFHLRIRWHVTAGKLDEVIGLINKHIQPYCDSGLIWKVDLSTYERELNRYDWDNIGISETLFWHDSEMVIKLLDALKENGTEEWVGMYCLKCIDDLLQVFEYTLNDKLSLMDELATAFGNEFRINKDVKIKISDKFRTHSSFLEMLMQNEGNESLNRIIGHRNRMIRAPAAMLLKNVPAQKIRDLLGSHIHMHLNRMIRTNPRLHELVLYGILEKYYRKRYGHLNLKKV